MAYQRQRRSANRQSQSLEPRSGKDVSGDSLVSGHLVEGGQRCRKGNFLQLSGAFPVSQPRPSALKPKPEKRATAGCVDASLSFLSFFELHGTDIAER